jgi:Fe-S oxidoreductase/electron transfer flavoprotein alpha/beta subunit
VETREVFWALGTQQLLTFYAVGVLAIAVFLYGVYRHFAKYRRAQPLPAAIDIVGGAGRMLSDLATHRTLRRRDRLAGWAHAGILLGFLGGFIGTTLIVIEVDILSPLFGITFWKGKTYLLSSLLLDLGHLALVAGLVYLMLRRAAFGLPKLDYLRGYRGETALRPAAVAWRREDWFFVLFLLVVEITGFYQEGVRIVMEQPDWAAWSPIGNAVATLLRALGVDAEAAAGMRAANWWVHGFLALGFTAAIPWYKAKHIIAVLGSLSLRDTLPLSRLPREKEGADGAGVGELSDFTWKDMLHFDACTKCGRCHEACPARAAGYPLSPRDLILDLRLYNDRRQGKPAAGESLIGDVIDPETLWSCRACGACQEICPVGIEHPSIIVRMRRRLVEQGAMDPLLQTTLGAIGDTGNSFGENARKRPAWTRELEFKVKDIREEPADNLWFVGDYASFDPRNQKVSQSVARLLKAADVDYALLHESEWTAGNDVRRTGEEGLFESIVEHNLEEIGAAKPFNRIITTDPHSYNTLRNEYPEFGDVAPIEHYSSVLRDLLKSGRLKVAKPLGRRVTFHDPCHLGRLNGGYDAPREVLRLIGCEVVEMPRNRDNSFCCGAGGGRIWIPDQPGIEKPSENRMHEAAALGPIDIFVTCCPKDLTMFEDARKTSGHEKDFVVQDLAELVAEAIELEKVTLKDVPSLVERIAEAVAARVADSVAARLDEVLATRLGGAPSPLDAPAAPTPAIEPPPMAEPAPAAPAAPPEPVAEPAAPPPVALKAMDWDNPAPVQPAELPAYEIPPRDGPRILVAVKHAAVLGDEHEFTADGRDIKQDFLEFTLNEWDDAALEEALRTIEKIGGGEVVAVAVGPEGADASLRKVLAKGASRAVRVWDDSLAGADPVTVARAIAGVARAEAPDLIFTGVQSSDQAHGATGTALARILGLPHAAVAIGIEWDGDATLTVTRELEGGARHNLELPSPAVLTIQTGINEPRYATMRMIKQAKQKPLVALDGAGVMDGSGGYAIRRMYVPEQTKAEMLGGGVEEIAAFIANIIREKRGD